MKIPRLTRFILAAAAIVLQAGAAQAAMKTQWIDYKQGNTALHELVASRSPQRHFGNQFDTFNENDPCKGGALVY